MKCPYCDGEYELFSEIKTEFVGEGVSFDSDNRWDEFRCECPGCGKTFRAFEYYTFSGEGSKKMEDE